MIFVFYFFAVVLVFLGYKSLRGGIAYLSFFKRELAAPLSNYTPFCSIIAPCRGLEDDLEENLSALFHQKFPAYEIIFVVDDANDAAVPVIEELLNRRDAETQRKNYAAETTIENEKNSASPRLGGENITAKMLIAGKAIGESQKVHNLREAVLHVAAESKIFVFVDSDARPNEDWLRNLIAPLRDETVGAATGYRWFIQQKGNFATHLRSVWNASIASALGANRRKNFCWGGATAMRRETFERIEMRERWRGTLSDDFTMTRVLREHDLPIRFVPQALTASIEDCSLREMFEFTTRQMKITRVYAAHLWQAALVGSIVFSIVFWSGVALLFFISGWHFWLTLGLMLTIFALGAAKAYLRLQAVNLVLKDYRNCLRRQILPHLTLWTLTPILYFYNCSCALLSHRIVWRGIKYDLKSPDETDIL